MVGGEGEWLQGGGAALEGVGEVTSNFQFLQALIHGLGRHYYSLPINYRKNDLEQKVCPATAVTVLDLHM